MSSPRSLSRRALLKSAGALGLSGALAEAVASRPGRAAAAAGDTLPFAGVHQQGVSTAQQASLCLAAFDLRVRDAAHLRHLMRRWSKVAARMAAGRSGAGGDDDEVAGLPAARLSVTFGFGAGVFSLSGLRGAAPRGLRPLPHFAGEQLEHRRGGGDLVIQACADDAMVAFHAARELYRAAGEQVSLRWMQRGFLPSSAPAGQTPRNLMGFKDGTLNIRPGQPGFDEAVWVGAGDEPRWLRDGTFMVFRRIRMNLPRWDASSRSEQELTFGRAKASGAPLGGRAEFDLPDFARRTAGGHPLIPLGAHVRVAHPDTNGGIRILRRGYSYDEGVVETGPLSDHRPHSHQADFDAGLAFVAFMRDPHAQFVPLQRRLSRFDHLNEYVTHVGSAVFAVAPGASAGGYVGETLLA